jgi:hypothetical protein
LDYVRLCEAVTQVLHALASDLQDHVIDLVTAATFSVVATAMIQHAGQGWAPPSNIFLVI